jgi:hypothetical protein|tara:strand:+ start:492 stop:734 length:243 start_codon:yes stop_codon:yes gene_type:complete
MTDGWEGTFQGNGEELEAPMLANLFLDNDTRLWRLELQGPAAMLLFFLLDSGENGIIQKLWDEAKFDRLVKYDLGELDVE